MENNDNILAKDDTQKLREEWNANAPRRMKEFENLAKPLIEWLWENYNPHAEIRITWERAEIFCSDMGIPFPDVPK